jgi:hypothetical protein
VAFALLGAAVGFFGTCVWNAALDGSEPTYRDVRVIERWQETTYPLCIRRYEIEYAPLAGGNSSKYPARVELMDEFTLPFGVLEVGSGALGMEWVRAIHPVVLVPLEAGDPPTRAVMTIKGKAQDGNEVTLQLKPMIQAGKDKLLEPSQALGEEVRKAVPQ